MGTYCSGGVLPRMNKTEQGELELAHGQYVEEQERRRLNGRV